MLQATPDLRSRAGIIEYLTSFDLFKGNEWEGEAYVRDAIGRMLMTVRMVPPAPARGASLLELGANPYFITLLLKKFHTYDLHMANYFGPQVGLDEDQQTITSERYGETHTFRYTHFNVEFDTFPYPDESFDGVLFCEILEHLTVDPTHTLSEIRRVLKPNGWVIVTTPNMLRWEHVRDLVRGQNFNDPYSGYGVYGRHNREYAPDEVIKLLQSSGFSVQQVRLANVHVARFGVPHLVSAVRRRMSEHIFALGRADIPPRSVYPTWLYRSTFSLRKVDSNEIKMGRNDMKHSGMGWFPQETFDPTSRWTQQRAELFLRAQGNETRLYANINGLGARLGAVTLTLRCGEAIRQYTLTTDEWTTLELPIATTTAGDELLLEIEVDKLRCPMELGISQEPRHLGVLVQHVALHP